MLQVGRVRHVAGHQRPWHTPLGDLEGGRGCVGCLLIFLNIFTFPGGGLPWHVSRGAWDVSTCKVRSVFLAEEVMPHVSRRHFCSQKASLLPCPQCQSIGQPCHEEHCHCTAVRPSHGISHHLHILWGGTCDQFQALQDCYHESRCHRVSRCNGHIFFFYCSLASFFLRFHRTHTSTPRASHYSSAGSCLAWVWQIIWLALHTLMMLSGHATPAPMPQFRFSLQPTPTKARSWVRTQISLWHHTNLPLGRPMYIPVAAPAAFSATRLSHPARDLAQSLELPYLRAGLSCMPRELVPSSSPMPVKIVVCDPPW